MPRASGVLLHVTSLPSAFGIGDLGPESYRFVSLLSQLGQRYWSILPLSPTRLEDANSPYQTSSAYAGNPLLISPEKLVENHMLSKTYLPKAVVQPTSKVDFARVTAAKEEMLETAYANFDSSGRAVNSDFDIFCQDNASWLNDYAFFAALRKQTGKPWYSWPAAVRTRDGEALKRKESALKQEIEKQKFAQWLFFSQLSSLRALCKANGVQIIGDMPFYVAYDSVDVWAHQDLFSLNSKDKPMFVGGVPPDYFSTSGQLWGNPTYNWQKLEETGFQWWISRIRHNLKLCDKLRLDHFRGFVAYWQVAASAKTAKNGRWVKTPSDAFFKAVKAAFPSLPFIAEDLGDIDEPVRHAVKRLGVPGMRVLLFAFDGSQGNPHLPSNHTRNSVAYTGTHDTNTAKGWFVEEASAKEKRNLFKLVGRKIGADEVSFELVKTASSSKSDLSIFPLQDILGLDSKARMNNPGKPTDNWRWRVLPQQLTSQRLNQFKQTTIEQHRVGP